MTRIYEISDQLVEKIAALHPIVATSLGVPGYESGSQDEKPDTGTPPGLAGHLKNH